MKEERKTDDRTYMPRCRTCGPLAPADTLERALDAIARHRRDHPAHKTGYVPVRTTNTERHQES